MATSPFPHTMVRMISCTCKQTSEATWQEEAMMETETGLRQMCENAWPLGCQWGAHTPFSILGSKEKTHSSLRDLCATSRANVYPMRQSYRGRRHPVGLWGSLTQFCWVTLAWAPSPPLEDFPAFLIESYQLITLSPFARLRGTVLYALGPPYHKGRELVNVYGIKFLIKVGIILSIGNHWPSLEGIEYAWLIWLLGCSLRCQRTF